jgi:hypothetical protein
MSTISNMNIVVQQSGDAKNAQNIRHATQEFSHLAADQQKEREVQQRRTVQQSGDPKQAKLGKETPDKRKQNRNGNSRNSESNGEPDQKKRASGKILDTVA